MSRLRRAGGPHTEGVDEIGTHRLLTGLLTEGVAAAILERLDVRADAIRAASQRLFGPPAGVADDQTPPMSTEAVRALDAAACNAAASGSPDTPTEVRTEHLLAVLALDPGSRARRVLNDLGVDIAAIKRELQCHIAVNPTRPARWWKRRPPDQHGCSFCGRTTAAAVGSSNGPAWPSAADVPPSPARSSTAVSPTPDRPAPRWQPKRRAHPPRPGPPPPVPPAVGPKPGRKGRAFRSLDTLLIRHGGRDVLHGSVLALASAKRSRACLRGMGISSKAGHAHRHPGARPDPAPGPLTATIPSHSQSQSCHDSRRAPVRPALATLRGRRRHT